MHRRGAALNGPHRRRRSTHTPWTPPHPSDRLSSPPARLVLEPGARAPKGSAKTGSAGPEGPQKRPGRGLGGGVASRRAGGLLGLLGLANNAEAPRDGSRDGVCAGSGVNSTTWRRRYDLSACITITMQLDIHRRGHPPPPCSRRPRRPGQRHRRLASWVAPPLRWRPSPRLATGGWACSRGYFREKYLRTRTHELPAQNSPRAHA